MRFPQSILRYQKCSSKLIRSRTSKLSASPTLHYLMMRLFKLNMNQALKRKKKKRNKCNLSNRDMMNKDINPDSTKNRGTNQDNTMIKENRMIIKEAVDIVEVDINREVEAEEANKIEILVVIVIKVDHSSSSSNMLLKSKLEN
jgi:hypothetical protein